MSEIIRKNSWNEAMRCHSYFTDCVQRATDLLRSGNLTPDQIAAADRMRSYAMDQQDAHFAQAMALRLK